MNFRGVDFYSVPNYKKNQTYLICTGTCCWLGGEVIWDDSFGTLWSLLCSLSHNYLSDAQDFQENLIYCSEEENAFLRKHFKVSNTVIPLFPLSEQAAFWIFKKSSQCIYKSIHFVQYGTIVMKCFALIVVHQCTFIHFV